MKVSEYLDMMHRHWTVFPPYELVQVMKRNLSSLKTDKAKLSAELQEKQGGLTSLTEETQELKAKQDRVSLQVHSVHMYMLLHACCLHVLIPLLPTDFQAGQGAEGYGQSLWT